VQGPLDDLVQQYIRGLGIVVLGTSAESVVEQSKIKSEVELFAGLPFQVWISRHTARNQTGDVQVGRNQFHIGVGLVGEGVDVVVAKFSIAQTYLELVEGIPPEPPVFILGVPGKGSGWKITHPVVPQEFGGGIPSQGQGGTVPAVIVV